MRGSSCSSRTSGTAECMVHVLYVCASATPKVRYDQPGANANSRANSSSSLALRSEAAQ
jgi:hypothetical protein